MKNDVGMGLLVGTWGYLGIHISSLCGFWHCHPYIPIHFWKMFFILYLKLLEPTRQLQQKQCHSKCNKWGVWPFPKTWGGYSPPSPPASYASERERMEQVSDRSFRGKAQRSFIIVPELYSQV